MAADPEPQSATDIAIVGLAGRFPGAWTPETFWRNLRDGVESIRRLSDAELLSAGVDPATLAATNYVKAAAILDGLPFFDAGFFGFSAKEAAILDPQHRHFLEVAWEALEDAGHVPDRFDGSIGVFGGCGMNAYFMFNLLTNPSLVSSVGLFLLRHTGNDKDFLTTRVSYCLNLTGPSVGIQTACSTSLVAVHAACQSLLSGECDMALAGGSTIEIPHGQGYLYEEGEILSPDGHCRAFDADSKGTVFGSGAGIVVLRRLADAVAAGDRVRAVIKGSAVNNDGSSKVGYLAPSVDGQAKAIREALSVAGVSARSVTYVEAHGTGTPVGDPIEVAALTQAFRQDTDAAGFCGLGSLKTNIGHLDTAAGIASLIKVVLALEHRALPPSLNFVAPNPAMDLTRTPFVINGALRDWPAGDTPRRAGINSLGVGGTNAHVVVEEAPPGPPPSPAASRSLIVLSARSAPALDAAADRLADYLTSHPEVSLADVSFTLQDGRRAFPHRRALVCASGSEAIDLLRGRDVRRTCTAVRGEGTVSAVFLFPGGGAQYPNMGRDLYTEEPVFREATDRCLAFVRELTGRDLRSLMFPAPSGEAEAARALQVASNSVLAVFICEYALARLWMTWGVTPVAMTGHSLGEYTAACLAGVLSLEDALTVVAARGEIFDRLPPGSMLSVPMAEAALRPLLTPTLSLASVNAPELCVVSGPVAEVDAFEQSLAAGQVDCRRLHIAVAAHSAMLDPFLDDFAKRLTAIRMNHPLVPFISNRTGGWATPRDLSGPEYWVRHLRDTVRFSSGLETVLARVGPAVLIEVGPGQTLTSLARLHLTSTARAVPVPSLRHPDERVSDVETVMSAVGRAWAAGLEIDWKAFHSAPRQRVPLPTYPFEHQDYWIAAGRVAHTAGSPSPGEQPPVAKIADTDGWFWRPVWRPAPRPVTSSSVRPNRLVALLGDDAVSRAIPSALGRRGIALIGVRAGAQFARTSPTTYEIRPGEPEDFESLLSALRESGSLPDRILHLWSCAPADADRRAADVQAVGFETLVAVTQALGAESSSDAVDITVVTAGLERVLPLDRVTSPDRATVVGPVLVAPKELPHVRARTIDLPLSVLDSEPDAALIDVLVQELVDPVSDSRVALRESRRFVEDLDRLPVPPSGPSWVTTGGHYLVTGGTSGIGLELARRISAMAPVTLTLVSRTGLPARQSWSSLSGVVDARVRLAIAAIREMEAAGATVRVMAADVADAAALAGVMRAARSPSGRLHAVVHAAGVIDDSPLQVKDRTAMRRVLAPKVDGLLALAAAWAAAPPDLVVLCSSTSAWLGLPGQIDYTAANAFLSAYARAYGLESGPRILAVQWGAWRDVGMAARAAQGEELSVPRSADNDAGHPLLGTVVHRTPDEVTFETSYAAPADWVLDEHRLRNGQALLPGTGFLEMARAAFAAAVGPGPIEIRDAFFLASLEVNDHEPKRVRVTLRRDGEAWAFSVSSETGGVLVEHARALLAALTSPVPVAPDRELLLRGALSTDHFHDLGGITRQERQLRFGPRWKSLHAVAYGADYAVARVELPSRFTSDLDTWTLHPALLDLATAAGLPLVAGDEDAEWLFIPLSYGRVRVYAPLTRSLWSVVRPSVPLSAGATFVEFDVVLIDDAGHVLLEAQSFLMRKTSPAEVAARLQHSVAAPASTLDAHARLASIVRAGISPDEGWTALGRVLQVPALREVVVSSIDPAALRPQATLPRRSPPARSSAGRSGSAPLGPAEEKIAEMWRDLLGVDDVGPDDDFFELGGHSLIAVRLVARMEKAFPKKLRLATLFEARTVRDLAAIVEERKAMSEWVTLVPIQTKGDKPPIFCVHGVGGEVLSYSALANRMAPDQPLVAFRAIGHDGKAEPLATIEEQAAAYIKELLMFRPDGPYHLGGYSHGGRVALEMARQLKSLGKDIAFLGIIDISPGEVAGHGPLWAIRFARNLPLWFWFDGRRTGLRGNLDRLRRAFAKLGHLLMPSGRGAGTGGAPRVEDTMNIAGLPPSIQRVYQANFRAFKQYQPRPYDGPVTLFRSLGQPLFTQHEPDLGWRRVATGRVTVRHVPGNHLSILSEPEVARLATELRDALAHDGGITPGADPPEPR